MTLQHAPASLQGRFLGITPLNEERALAARAEEATQTVEELRQAERTGRGKGALRRVEDGPRTTLRAAYVKVHVWCKACRHQAAADREALVAGGRGDVPLRDLRFWCTNCRGSMTDFVVTGGADVKPW